MYKFVFVCACVYVQVLSINANRRFQEHTVRIQGCLRHDSAFPLSLKRKE